MLILGLSGNFSPAGADLAPFMPDQLFHHSAACLVRDGVVIAAVEEERLNRIKRTAKFPLHAIRECLAVAGVSITDVDGVAFYFREDYVDTTLNFLYALFPQVPTLYSRQLIKRWFADEFAWALTDEKLIFAPHHDAHAMSTVMYSGIPESLVLVLDGRGEENSGTVYRAGEGRLEKLADYPAFKSLGMLYLNATQLLGYGFGDEYKMMGLAPYGDPETYRDAFSSLYLLRDKGEYDLLPSMVVPDLVGPTMLARGFTPRRKGEPFTQQHRDFAAAAQETLELIVMHVLAHWAEETGLPLCFGGGVAHNSSLNGVILRSGLFKEVFVHPASHDAGASEGAAFLAAGQLGVGSWPGRRVRTASVGPPLGSEAQVRDRLAAWRTVIDCDRQDDIVDVAAGLLAKGSVLGWAQGRSEFGPRALGNRSIVADPRPKENQDRINRMVKKRESFRPFAPVTTGAAAASYFDLPAEVAANHDFMSFVVPVREERRPELGAVTHVDGTARIQIVDPAANARFHRLVVAFGERTGTPVLLNTSFNNNAEPIVQTVDDVVTCFLTTDLDYLVVEDFLVHKRFMGRGIDLTALVLRFRPVTRLVERFAGEPGVVTHEITLDYFGGPTAPLSPSLYALLSAVDGTSTFGELVRAAGGVPDSVPDELYGLWQQRFVTLTPPLKACS